MSGLEIALLLLGAVVFVVSFFLPEGKNALDSESDFSSDKVKEMVEQECKDAKIRLQDMADETVSYSLEKAERSMERLTNEKMMALGEYSDAIMTQINTNHQETVFMYDMLNGSKENMLGQLADAQVEVREVLTMAGEAKEDAITAKDMAEQAMQRSQETMELANAAREQMVIAEETMVKARKTMQEMKRPEVAFGTDTGSMDGTAGGEENETKKKTTVKKRTKKVATPSQEIEEILPVNEEISIQFAPGEENGLNSNEKILKLHKQGKSNMAIAKELGLGIGEVKLVIDLFEKK